MAGFHFQQDDLDHLQRIADNIPAKPYQRRPFDIKPAMSLREISEEIGVSKEMVRHIIDGALRKIRKRYRYGD